MKGLNDIINRFGEWVIRLVILNLYWFGFSIIGLGILGIFPATSAMFSVLRKWLIGNKNIKITSEFIRFYKKDFWNSNALGYFFLAAMVILWTDYQFINSIEKFSMFALSYLILIILFFLLLSLCVLFPVYAHYRLTFLQYIKNSILFPLTNILPMIIMVASLFVILYLFYQAPGLILLSGVSLPAFVVMKITSPIFQGKKLSVNGFFKIFKSAKRESMYY